MLVQMVAHLMLQLPQPGQNGSTVTPPAVTSAPNVPPPRPTPPAMPSAQPPTVSDSAKKDAKPTEPQEKLLVAQNIFLNRYDRNGDGRLSLEEIPPNLSNAFRKSDFNGDGSLDAAEVLQNKTRIGMQARKSENLKLARGELIERGRNDNDGVKDKVVAIGFEVLLRMDVDGDGVIDQRELMNVLHQPRLLFANGEVVVPPINIAAMRNRGDLNLQAQANGREEMPSNREGNSTVLNQPSNTDPNQPPPRPNPNQSPSVAQQSPAGTSANPGLRSPGRSGQGNSLENASSEIDVSKYMGPDGLPTADGVILALDNNDNGVVDRDEALDRLADNFKMLDKNKDNALDRAEIERSLKLARMFGVKPSVDPKKFQERLEQMKNKSANRSSQTRQ